MKLANGLDTKMIDLTTNRLRLTPLSGNDIEIFTRMIQDPYIGRYLFDGEMIEQETINEYIQKSNDLFQSSSIGLWIIRLQPVNEPIGFCGFFVFPEVSQKPQLTYALFENHTGNGYVKEASEAVMDYAFNKAGLTVIHSAADEPNLSSIQSLESLHFTRTGEIPGNFGKILLYRKSKDESKAL